MFLDAAQSPKHNNLLIVSWFSPTIEVENCYVLCQLLNVINYLVMDIGHFAFNTENGGIFFLGDVNMHEKNLNSQQLMASLKRIIHHGTTCFKYLLEMVNCSQAELESIVYEMVQRISEEKNKQIDTEKGRIIMRQIRECFEEYENGSPMKTNNEEQGEASGCEDLYCIVTMNDCSGLVRASLRQSVGLIRLSMFFKENISETLLPGFYAVMNKINLQIGGACLIKIQRERKCECRSAYLLSDQPFNKAEFKGVLEKFLKVGMVQYSLYKKFMANSEKVFI